jgi:hypothetical protein
MTLSTKKFIMKSCILRHTRHHLGAIKGIVKERDMAAFVDFENGAFQLVFAGTY